MDRREQKEFIEAVKEAKKIRGEGSSRSIFGKILPRGITHPDKMVKNRHLYMPWVKGKTDLR